MNYITNGKLFIGKSFIKGSILFSDKIERIDLCSQTAPDRVDPSSIIDAEGCYVIPGLIDIHTHASVGQDASDGNKEGIEKMCTYYSSEGVTSYLPTTMTLSEEELIKAVRSIKAANPPLGGAKIAGINLEGPFLSYEKRGAQNGEYIHKPDIDMFHRLNEESGNIVKLITIAPEECDADMSFIKEASRYCHVSLGHTTADYDTAIRAFMAGADHATHLYNGMPGLLHREPGVIGAARDAGAYVELITDGFHSHPSTVRFTYSAFGDKVTLISDSARCAGMPDGDYELGGQPVELKNGKCTLKGTDTLAGSCIHLMDGVRRSVSFGIPLETAIYAATAAPALSIGIEKETGFLKTGLMADIVILDKDLKVKAVYINGTMRLE